MKFKPDKETLMDYLYGELEGEEKKRVEDYLAENPETKKELEGLQEVRNFLGVVEDREVIAPPIFIDHQSRGLNWNSPYIKVILSIAASLLLLLLVGKLTKARIGIDNQSFELSFGEPVERTIPPVLMEDTSQKLTEQQVQQMINQSISRSNDELLTHWNENQKSLYADLKNSWQNNSRQVGHAIENNSVASDSQIREYLAGLQVQNMEMVKDYFQMTSSEQKEYMEELLVDFAKYLQQQRSNDLQLLQTQIHDLEQHNDIFKQETEQIISRLINQSGVKTVKN